MSVKGIGVGCKVTVCLIWLVICGQVQGALVAHYTFDDEANLGADSSGLGNDLVSEGTPVYTASGIIGGAVDLDVDSWFVRDYYDDGTATGLAFPTGVPAAPAAGNGSYTLAAWTFFDSPDDLNCGIVGWGNWVDNGTNVLRIDPDDGVQVVSNYWWHNDLTVVSEVDFKDGNWHHLAVTYDEGANSRVLYVDGTAIGTDAPASGHDMAPINFSVGGTRVNRNGGGTVQSFVGLLDDVQVHDAALSETEIADLASIQQSLPGDLNDDGFVGGDDLDIVRGFWGQNVTAGDLESGDPSGDGFVGGDDLDIVRANWGEGTPPTPSAVPEPSMFAGLIALALAAATVARRRGS